MGRCPHCDTEVAQAVGSYIREGPVFDEEEVDAISAMQHIQLHCPDCDTVLGYIGVGGAAGVEP